MSTAQPSEGPSKGSTSGPKTTSAADSLIPTGSRDDGPESRDEYAVDDAAREADLLNDRPPHY